MREDVKMRRCEDEKMRYRPPLLEEPCAQTLSGKNNCCFGGVCLDSKGCGLILRWQDDRSHGTCQKLSKQKLVWILECPRWTITFGIGGWPATMGFPSARDKSLTWLAKVTCETMVDELCESLKKYPRVFRRAQCAADYIPFMPGRQVGFKQIAMVRMDFWEAALRA